MKKLHEMTLQEKVGQLLMVGFCGTEEVPQGMTELIRDYNLGGAIYFSRNVQSPEQLANLSMKLQTLAKESSAGLPLFISIDQEGGIVSRLPGSATIFPGNMALGAMHDPERVYGMAKVVAKELKALGVNLNLAPVLDVNNNPHNPVIGVRSYGEDPALVSELGCAYIRGLQEEGVLACGKHFPGHGDTDFDSHLALASVLHAKERLNEVEMKPFREAIAAGLSSIMSAHVIFPAFEPEGMPGTLSKRVLTDLLRNELGFAGLILTDCMEMKAIDDHYGTGEAAVRAIEAGVDQILVSHTFEKQLDAYRSILRAVESGRLTAERIEQSVARILTWKQYLNWDRWRADPAALREVGSAEHRALAAEIGQRVVTLVKNEAQVIPAVPAEHQRVLLVYPVVKMTTMVEEKDAGPREAFYHAFQAIYPAAELVTISLNPDRSEMARVKTRAKDADLVICSAFFAARNPAQAQLINELAGEVRKLVVVAVRNPYDLQVLPRAAAYLTTYDYNDYSLCGVARVIAGQAEARGVLPITIPGGAV